MNWMKGRMTLYINIDRNQWTLYKLNELQKADGYISSERLYQRVTVMSGSLGSRVLSRRGDLRCQNIRPNVSNLTINRWAIKLMCNSFSINRLFYRSNYSNQWSIIFWMLIRSTLLKPPLCFFVRDSLFFNWTKSKIHQTNSKFGVFFSARPFDTRQMIQ